jgi:hypothetical protein
MNVWKKLLEIAAQQLPEDEFVSDCSAQFTSGAGMILVAAGFGAYNKASNRKRMESCCTFSTPTTAKSIALHLSRRSNPGAPLWQTGDPRLEILWSAFRKSETILALWRKPMMHDHGNEYQIKIVHGDGTEELSALLNSMEQVAQVMTAADRPQGKTYFLLVRNVLCSDCSDKEQIIMECAITNIPSPRFMPHDSGYLKAVDSRNRYALGLSESMHIR